MRVAASSLSVPFEESDAAWSQRSRDSNEASTSATVDDKQQRAPRSKPLKINLDLALVRVGIWVLQTRTSDKPSFVRDP